ncbi:tripartite tricarboxylate transporter substrate binding protein [Pseudoroseomonas wenyumeiae]|uniref:Tripartite tricarboxylate transporter substrate binding protein n=1 Tax=Teichococcus wenyumeiae TaxID=2478470 RepID=A0A3A9JK74_9PROT|nr:tripartite tricarboxylate transporter substrate binding protein [Pseudoroseomonas wenyumeiae]RKK05631.1 tripartite tricarboxylate transporter substrate binding protein [Pseudoroseomonas wenyumeiae]RMI25083.1 tripartite tricarboxylate transporter substrate binding protein [Pseudoroseomonas wenyumeiae]
MTKAVSRRRVLAGLALAGPAWLGLARGATAQGAWPSQPVRIIVPFEPGGPADAIARVVAARLGEKMGQPFVVENRSGASSAIGTAVVARAKPDGYNLLLGTSAFSGNVALGRPLTFDTRKDLAPIALMGVSPAFLMVSATLPVRSVRELIDYVRQRPDGVTYASPGAGTFPHLAVEMFNLRAGTQMLHVPYRGTAPALTDMVTGRVQAMISDTTGAMQHIQAGAIRVLAAAAGQRSDLLPEVPTLRESGLSDYAAESWFGLIGPAGVPADIQDRLATAVAEVLAEPDATRRMRDIGSTPRSMKPAEFASYVARDIDQLTDVVRAADIKVD